MCACVRDMPVACVCACVSARVCTNVRTIADANDPKGSLNKAEFDVALKLIALKQAGVEPTMDNILQSAALPSLGDHSAKVAASLAPPPPAVEEPQAPPAMSFLDVMAAAWKRIEAGVDASGKITGVCSCK